MWTNKHVIVALLVAPVLALLAYFGVDALVSQRPAAAQPGAAYPLRVMSNCRYASGECDLQNGDVRVLLRLDGPSRWMIESQVDLNGVLLSSGDDQAPVRFESLAGDLRRWSAPVQPHVLAGGVVLRLVVAVAGSQYYAEFPAVFVRAAARRR